MNSLDSRIVMDNSIHCSSCDPKPLSLVTRQSTECHSTATLAVCFRVAAKDCIFPKLRPSLTTRFRRGRETPSGWKQRLIGSYSEGDRRPPKPGSGSARSSFGEVAMTKADARSSLPDDFSTFQGPGPPGIRGGEGERTCAAPGPPVRTILGKMMYRVFKARPTPAEGKRREIGRLAWSFGRPGDRWTPV